MDFTLPLLDLHRHLDGNIRPKTIWQLAQQNQIQLPVDNFADFIPFVQIEHSEANLLDFLKKLDWGVSVLSHIDDIKRVAFENVEDVFNAGIDYAELRFSPYYMAMTHNLSMHAVVEAVIEGITTGMKAYPVNIKLIGIMSRTFGVTTCQKELEALLAFKDHLVGIDLAGDEYNFPGDLFVDHFKQVRDAGLGVTIHAGEAGNSASIFQAINDLGATRIGHGVAAVQDDKLMDYMAQHNIAIESCLTSNFQTGTVKDLANHPIKTFLQRGIKVCLNTDDPAVQGIELKGEFLLAKQTVNLSLTDINQLQQNAIEVSFQSLEDKAILTKQLLYKTN